MKLTWFVVFLVSLCNLEWTAPVGAQQLQGDLEDAPWRPAARAPGPHDAAPGPRGSDSGARDTFRQTSNAKTDSRDNEGSWLGGK